MCACAYSFLQLNLEKTRKFSFLVGAFPSYQEKFRPIPCNLDDTRAMIFDNFIRVASVVSPFIAKDDHNRSTYIAASTFSKSSYSCLTGNDVIITWSNRRVRKRLLVHRTESSTTSPVAKGRKRYFLATLIRDVKAPIYLLFYILSYIKRKKR